MNIIIYNINSFGGTYEYAKFLFKAYVKNPAVSNCVMLMPVNAEINEINVLKTLCSDISSSPSKFIRRVYFLYRSFINPLRLYRFLKKQPASIVLFNDFDQYTAWFWVPILHLLKKKHRFAVILHDPDRDTFFPVKFLSESTMSSIMSLIDVAFYHSFLPEKKYYTGAFMKVDVPHGIYDNVEVDNKFLCRIKQLAGGQPLIGVLGNIRAEKNYEIIIDALKKLDNVKLLVAGKPASSAISVNRYKQYAEVRNVEDKIIWMTQYLEQSQFNASIEACEIIVLYYKQTFASQSGILNSIAPFNKKLIISDTKSALKESVVKYNLAEVVPGNNLDLLVSTIKSLLTSPDEFQHQHWQNYIKNSSWDKHIEIAVESYKKL